MTSLMVKYANEIAETMAKSLGDEEFTKLFKTASVEKTAGPVLEAFKKEIDKAILNRTNLELVYSKFVNPEMQPNLTTEENKEPGTIVKAREYMSGKAPGMIMPEANDDCMTADCMEGMMAEDEIVAAEFTLGHLAKIADVLDNRGFNRLANILDETMQKIASQKK